MLGSTIKTHYPGDQPLAADVLFLEWIAALERVMRDFGGDHLPYSLPLHEGTGLECWHDMYADGFTPQEAFDEDMSNWQ